MMSERREIKLVTDRCRIPLVIPPEEPSETCEWYYPQETYSIRSTVLGGEAIADVGAGGKRYVYAGGTKFVELTKRFEFPGGPTGVPYDSVQYYHNDEAGVSQRVTQNYPEALLGQPSYNPNYIDPRQNEYDTFGTNVGLVSQQLQQPSAPADPPIPYDGDAYVYIDGIKGKIYLDGLPLSGQHAAAYINTGYICGYFGITYRLMLKFDARYTNIRVAPWDSNREFNYGTDLAAAQAHIRAINGYGTIYGDVNWGFSAGQISFNFGSPPPPPGLTYHGLSATKLRMIAKALQGMASNACANAFIAAGLAPPDQVINSGMSIFAADLLRSSTNLGEMGLNSNSEADNDFRKNMLGVLNRHPSTNDITPPPQLAHTGRLYMALTQRAFNETDGPFAVTFVHAWMHAAGALGRNTPPETVTRLIPTPGFPIPGLRVLQTTEEVPNAPGQRDLTWMDKEKYDAIIKNCTK